ncbi:MAG: SDR family oxidoreductase [Melioribacteraceae bacterium]|nr:SDR family oxidoreductase [Melioribacteraceae bacterium]MCF8354579.1 SDR family oxidoreductase [Melioribacteraceae bacterium]MCF8394931.1 SDR family oxidoreductase [Melioribacteraceae bacterium]MCF8420156.1 SDR family oxidoreductase [Melioribacteraceae bacterium]
MSEKNNITWITGAASGIGKELALAFTRNNKLIAASSRRSEALERLKKESDGIIPFQTDICYNAQVVKTVNDISKNYEIDCLINNAGVTSFTNASEDEPADIKNIIDTNLLGAIYTIKAVLPQMMERKKGMIINILSIAAKKVFTKSSAYAASKAGLHAYANVLREEMREYNIKVVNVLPGPTKTPIWPNEALEKYSDRMMSPSDVAKLVYHLYSLDKNMVPEEITLRPIKGDL